MKKEMREKVKALKRQMILEEAGKYFEEEGFESLTMQTLAKRCDVSVGALYKLFDSKEELFYAYVVREYERVFEEIVRANAAQSDPYEKLLTMVKLIFTHYSTKPKVILDPVAGDPLFFTKINLTYENPARIMYDYGAELLEEYTKANDIALDDPLEATYLLSGLMLGQMEHWLKFGGDLISRSRSTLQFFLNALHTTVNN